MVNLFIGNYAGDSLILDRERVDMVYDECFTRCIQVDNYQEAVKSASRAT